MTLAERSTHWLIISKPKSSNPIGRGTKHDEQADARERRRRAELKWKTSRRRPVIDDVRRMKLNRRMEPDDTIDAIRARGQSWTVADVDRLLFLLERFPDDPYLLDVLGDASQLVDHPTRADDFAFQCYQQAVAADPTYWTAHVSLGHWYDIAEDFPKSEQHFRKAIELGAGDQARVALASVIAQMGHRNAAFKLLDECEDSDDLDVATMRSEIADGMHDPVFADND